MLFMSIVLFFDFFVFSSRRRHTRCALVTGVQTCALPICDGSGRVSWLFPPIEKKTNMAELVGHLLVAQSGGPTSVINASVAGVIQEAGKHGKIGRASCRERGCQYV